ncbi:MAG: UvrD-helicase domain-containing protein [Oscillospiraceae bacterium]|nr:UvrD-helicase domain-containing protein [Oscillospiraceae bacterium]
MSINRQISEKDEFSHLNISQREAVLTTDGPLLLLAGAGSGKTTVLMNRIANLLKNEGVDGHEIIAITFTNKAAGEMKERLERMNIPGSEGVWASTFHSACAKILRHNISHIGYDSSFNIYDTADTASLMKRILKDLEIEERNFPHRTVLNYISRAKDDMIFADEFMANANKTADPRRKIIGEIYFEYEKRLKASNSLDFDDLILLTVRLFKENPDVLNYYQRRFRYVLVDEYQDTNNLQYLLTAAFAEYHGNICVVGDDDQSIYKFRGATIENILSFEKQFKNARVIRLEQNYRSTAAILNAANDVIGNNKGRKGKNLWTDNTEGDLPVLNVVNDEREEAEFVAEKILKSVAGGRKWQEHVILYRMNAQSNQFETAFKRFAVPYRVYGGTGFYERAEVKDMLAYLCVLHNPNDDVRLLRIINNPTRGIGDTTIERLRYIAGEMGISVFAAINECHNYENVKSAAGKLHKFKDMIDGLRKLAETVPLDVLYDELISQTGYIRAMQDKDSDENISRIENVRELKTNIIAFVNENGGSLFDFLSETALYTDLDRDDLGSDRVLMMTMHSAKGLEFDTVFIVGAEEGIFPGMRAMGEPGEMEEERRLCYVAMTRAKRILYFTSARRRMLFGRTSAAQPSRFVREIKDGNIEKNEPAEGYGFNNPDYETDFYTGYKPDNTFKFKTQEKPPVMSSPKLQKSVSPAIDFNKGDSVLHKAFGKGIITSVSPAGGDALLEIAFDEAGTKRLMLNSASRYLTKA